MKADVFPDFHINFLYIEVLQTVVYQIEVSFNVWLVFQQTTHYFDQDLIGKLLDYSCIHTTTLNTKGFQLIVAGLST